MTPEDHSYAGLCDPLGKHGEAAILGGDYRLHQSWSVNLSMHPRARVSTEKCGPKYRGLLRPQRRPGLLYPVRRRLEAAVAWRATSLSCTFSLGVDLPGDCTQLLESRFFLLSRTVAGEWSSDLRTIVKMTWRFCVFAYCFECFCSAA